MTARRVTLSRRDFLVGTASAGAALSLGLYLPLGQARLGAAGCSTEPWEAT